jgi:hypothetical protein
MTNKKFKAFIDDLKNYNYYIITEELQENTPGGRSGFHEIDGEQAIAPIIFRKFNTLNKIKKFIVDNMNLLNYDCCDFTILYAREVELDYTPKTEKVKYRFQVNNIFKSFLITKEKFNEDWCGFKNIKEEQKIYPIIFKYYDIHQDIIIKDIPKNDFQLYYGRELQIKIDEISLY